MIEDLVAKVRMADDEYRDAMNEVLKDLDCLRERLIAVIDGVDSFEDGLDKAKFEEEVKPVGRKR